MQRHLLSVLTVLVAFASAPRAVYGDELGGKLGDPIPPEVTAMWKSNRADIAKYLQEARKTAAEKNAAIKKRWDEARKRRDAAADKEPGTKELMELMKEWVTFQKDYYASLKQEFEILERKFRPYVEYAGEARKTIQRAEAKLASVERMRQHLHEAIPAGVPLETLDLGVDD